MALERAEIETAATARVTAAGNDRELMHLAKEGDRQAFGVLIRKHQKRIYRIALHMLHNSAEAEDICQDTFSRAYAALPRFDGRSQPYTWFYRIAVNRCLNRIRQRKKHRESSAVDDPRLEALLLDQRPGALPEERASARRMAQDLCAAIDALSESLRTTLILVVIDGLGHAQAAVVLACPEGTIAWRIHEARKRIRAHLIECGHDCGGVTP